MAVFLAGHAEEKPVGKLGLLAKVNEMTFSELIVPGRKVRFRINVDRHVGPFAFVSCEASEGDEKFAFGKLTLKIGE
jgi:3-hydroxymyristoyl/3-hydroxydecanoyl-(acyl carrier protein) dehydratase